MKPSFVASLHSCAHQLVRTAIETAAAAGTRMAAQEHVDALLLGTVRFFMACGTPWHVLQWFIIYTSALTLHLQIGRREGRHRRLNSRGAIYTTISSHGQMNNESQHKCNQGTEKTCGSKVASDRLPIGKVGDRVWNRVRHILLSS